LIEQGQPPLPALMATEELPDWLQDGDKVIRELQMEDKKETFGRGKRSRGAVKYNVDRDPLLDSDEDDEDGNGDNMDDGGSNDEEEEEEEEEEKPKRGRRSAGGNTAVTPKKTAGRTRKVEEVVSDQEEEEDETDENGRPKRKKRVAATASAAKTKAVAEVKKRGRQPKKQAKEESESEEDEEDERREYDVKEAALPHEKQKRLYRIWRTLVSINTGDHRVADFFMTLPDPKLYSDYYVLIKSPIAFDSIEQKIINNQYASISDFEADVMQLCANAQTYNQEGSVVYNDSVAIVNTYNTEKANYMQTGGDLLGAQVAHVNNLSVVDDDFGMDMMSNGGNQYEQPPF